MRAWFVLCILLLSVIVLPIHATEADDIPEEEPPEPPPNTAPYLLEPPFLQVVVDEEFEWEGRVAIEDNDTIEWDITTNMTEEDYTEYEWEPENYSVKLKIKCAQPFARWFNVSATDNYWPAAYWNWTVFCDDEGTRGDDMPIPRDANTDYAWCGSNCGGDGYQWDDEDNWRDTAAWTVNGYPEGNDDTASFNETADDLYLKHGANSVVTIGALTTTSGFTGTITFSIDLILDLAGGKNGSLNHKAAATIDVNTSNEQINMDGDLYISSSATFTERSGTLIVQGAKTQQIRVQITNKLYKLTTDTASTVGEIYDNLTAYQITIGTGTTYKADANTRGYELWTNFTDASGCGLVSTSAGTWQLIGASSGRQANVTTANAAPPPTNYFNMYATSATFDWTYTTVSYSTRMGPATTDFEGVTVSYTKNAETYVWATSSARTLTQFVDVTIDNLPASLTRGALYSYSLTYTDFQNVVIEDSATVNAISTHSARLEFVDSNFDINDIEHYTCGAGLCMVTSDNHNDVADAFKLHINDYAAKTDITNDFASGDNVEIVSGRLNVDEASASNDFSVASGAMMNITEGYTHTFDSGANMTINGQLNMTGANVTAGSGYFDFYNPGTVWLNDSEANSSDLSLPFSFYIGAGSNSTLNNYTANMVAQDLLLVISSETYAAKGSGIVWHMNVSLSSCVACFENVEFDFGNLTTGESYRLYNNGVLVGTKTADANGMVFFTSVIDDSADHLNLTHYTAYVPPPLTGGEWSRVLPIMVQLRYEYNIFSEVRAWLEINESFPLMDYYVWTTEDGRQWVTYEPYLNFSQPWEFRSDVPLYVEVRNPMGVQGGVSTTVRIDHTWLFILIFAIIFCVTVSYLWASKHKVIMRKLKKDVKL